MTRTLLLCFVHGFKGTDDTFHEFPDDLKTAVAKALPDHRVESVVYPQYETKGELAQATRFFLGWLKERVMEIRKAHCDNPWPPSDRDVGVILVAHSMGGFVAADTLFLAINEWAANPNEKTPIFPLIQGILTFDTPYNGLARSMFVYGAFSNYQKVSNVFNAMAALSAAAPLGLARLGARTAATRAAVSSRSPQWQAWQLVAVKTGTVGAIAAGGVAAYMNREAIMQGMKSMKNINKESVVEGYRQSMDRLGQGLAYINRGNVGKSFAWLSDHFTFVGSLLKQKELSRRLERMGALKGVGIHDYYCSLGENGYWSGGYFVPERTFCAVPEEDHAAYGIFSRWVMSNCEDEVDAHLSMFQPSKNKKYDDMMAEAAALVKNWFLSEDEVIDDPKFAEIQPEDGIEDKTVAQVLETGGSVGDIPGVSTEKKPEEGREVPDESPVDIAAAASLIPLPDDEGGLVGEASTSVKPEDAEEKRNYMRHLFCVAQQAGTGFTEEAKGWIPTKMPAMPAMPAMPSMPKVPVSVSSLKDIPIPGASLFSKKEAPAEENTDVKAEGSKDTGGVTDEVDKGEVEKKEENIGK